MVLLKSVVCYLLFLNLRVASTQCSSETPWLCQGGINMEFHNDSFLGMLQNEDIGYFAGDKGRIFFVRNRAKPIPRDFDARRKWQSCKSISQIKHQGSCSTSWAFVTAMVTTDRSCIASGGKRLFNVSEQDLITCCVYCYRDYYSDECTIGSGLISPLLYMTDYGVVTGDCKKYNTKTLKDGCKESCDSESISYKRVKIMNVVIGTRNESTVQDMQIEIMENGPIASMLHSIPSDFRKSYTNKVYTNTETNFRKDRGHAVRIVGWGQEGEVPYWLCANSWGTEWGKLGGFFKIKQGTNELGIEEFFIAVDLRRGKKQKFTDDSIFNPAGGARHDDTSRGGIRHTKLLHFYKIIIIVVVLSKLIV